MRLSYIDEFNQAQTCDLVEAVARECDVPPEGVGQTEINAENISALSMAYARLVSILHDRGILTDQMILEDILNFGYEKVKE